MIGAVVLLWLGILVFVGEAPKSIELAFPVIAELSDLRSAFLNSLGQVSDPEALVAGLAIGERKLLSEQAQLAMREVSLTHLVAVSGANLAIVMGAVWFLLGIIGVSRKLRFLFSGLALVGYVLLVGPEPSVIRAGAMALAVLCAMALGRGANPLHSLALAVLCLLLFDQSLARDLGFALSVIATTGLLIGARPIAERLGFLPLPLALALGAGVAAQVFTLPVMVLIQPGFPLYGILANLIVEPVVAPVTVLGILAVIAIPIGSLVSNLATAIAALGTSWILGVASFFAAMPETRLHLVGGFTGQVLLWVLVVGLAGVVTARGTLLKVAFALFGSASALLVVLSSADVLRHTGAVSNWAVMACDVGQGDAVLVRDSGLVAMIDVGKTPALVRRCLEDSRIQEIDLLILTHYDQDHVAGISGLSAVKIHQVLVSGFEDDRPVVSVVESELSKRGIKAKIALAGETAEFGACRLHILGPNNPELAETSNDASIASFFDCPRYQLLNLADTGDSAQERLVSPVQSLTKANLLRIVKVAHHGSADQNERLYEVFRPQVALYSVGVENNYGHPTAKTLKLTGAIGAKNLRTDLDGALGLRLVPEPELFTAGKLST